MQKYVHSIQLTQTTCGCVCVCSRVINRYAYILRFANCTKWAHKYLSKNTQTWSWNMQKLAQFARFFEEKVMYVHRTHTHTVPSGHLPLLRSQNIQTPNNTIRNPPKKNHSLNTFRVWVNNTQEMKNHQQIIYSHAFPCRKSKHTSE